MAYVEFISYFRTPDFDSQLRHCDSWPLDLLLDQGWWGRSVFVSVFLNNNSCRILLYDSFQYDRPGEGYGYGWAGIYCYPHQ